MTRTANEAVHSYVTDMVALENHIAKALKDHVEDTENDHPSVAAALRAMHGIVE